MNKKTKELVLIKSGEYMLDLSKLVFGGIVLVVIMQIESLSNRTLLVTGLLASVFTSVLGMLLVTFSQFNKKKGA